MERQDRIGRRMEGRKEKKLFRSSTSLNHTLACMCACHVPKSLSSPLYLVCFTEGRTIIIKKKERNDVLAFRPYNTEPRRKRGGGVRMEGRTAPQLEQVLELPEKAAEHLGQVPECSPAMMMMSFDVVGVLLC